jgi:hypothetical protein
MLLLAAADTEPDEIVSDYMEAVRLGDLRAATANRNNAEPGIDALCRAQDTTTEGAFRAAIAGLDVNRVLAAPKLSLPRPEGTLDVAGNALASVAAAVAISNSSVNGR